MSNVRELYVEKVVPVTMIRAEYIPQDLKDRIFSAAHYVCLLHDNGDFSFGDDGTPEAVKAMDDLHNLINQAEKHCPIQQKRVKIRKQ